MPKSKKGHLKSGWPVWQSGCADSPSSALQTENSFCAIFISDKCFIFKNNMVYWNESFWQNKNENSICVHSTFTYANKDQTGFYRKEGIRK